MKDIDTMTKDDLLADQVYLELIDIESDQERIRTEERLRERATTLKIGKAFNSMLKSFKDELKRQQKESQKAELYGMTDFSGIERQMYCGDWVANDAGIAKPTFSPVIPTITACHHPILITKRMQNLQSSEEFVTLMYHRMSEQWRSITVPRTIIASATQIVSLSAYGINVTSQNAKYMVDYLDTLESLNDGMIEIKQSSSKLGWITHNQVRRFLPYYGGIEFDGDIRFARCAESIRSCGSYELWKEHVRQIRATKRIEAKIMLAASFASAIIQLTGSLPFVIDLWGATEVGKTVMLMLAASVWANPATDAGFIGDYQTTDTALEVRCDLLNSLPMILDDSSKASQRIRESMEPLVYTLTAGKGKSRSNKQLGTAAEKTWANSTLTCGEKPLISYLNQGGAFNRVLEVEGKESLFSDPHYTVELIKSNYGYAGREFIEIVDHIGEDEIKKIFDVFFRNLESDDKMQKQAYSMAAILTADKIATEHIFLDDAYITIDEASDVLTDRSEVSEGARAYAYLLDKIEMNKTRFDPDDEKPGEKWGFIGPNDAVCFFPTAFHELLAAADFSEQAFVSWAISAKVLIHSAGRKDYLCRPKGSATNIPVKRCYALKVEQESESQWMSYEQSDLPFN